MTLLEKGFKPWEVNRLTLYQAAVYAGALSLEHGNFHCDEPIHKVT